jgi:hypothetical protein
LWIPRHQGIQGWYWAMKKQIDCPRKVLMEPFPARLLLRLSSSSLGAIGIREPRPPVLFASTGLYSELCSPSFNPHVS